jgi:TusA-related sulfurtransferase
MSTVEFDIRGQICPSTLLIALQEISNYSRPLIDGTIKLIFLTDNRDAVTTIPESVVNMGYAVNVIKKESFYLIEVSGGRQ